ncbi:MAG: prepilin-type N-terminal cleavage/methylation domain-containing protein [bacterium]|nr:prepilin-type N-terminal cleavage/methylation domain-containing protein [bacterium]
MIIKLRGIHLNGQSGRQGGFTLIESMIAIAILSLGLSGLTIMALNSVKANQQAKLRFMATDIITSESNYSATRYCF